MGDWQDDFNGLRPRRSTFATLLMWIVGLGLTILAAGFILGWFGTAANIATAPARVAKDTLRTENIISNYDAFFNRNEQYKSRLNQIKEHAAYMKETTDADERVRLRTELSTMRASCRNLAASYNADASKLTSGLFRSNNLPETLSMEACDA